MTGWPRGLEEGGSWALEHEMPFMKVLQITCIKVSNNNVTHIVKLIEL